MDWIYRHKGLMEKSTSAIKVTQDLWPLRPGKPEKQNYFFRRALHGNPDLCILHLLIYHLFIDLFIHLFIILFIYVFIIYINIYIYIIIILGDLYIVLNHERTFNLAFGVPNLVAEV